MISGHCSAPLWSYYMSGQHIPEMFAGLIITSSSGTDNYPDLTHHIRFSRKSTPIVFLYSAVKIPLQYFWIIEDLPTAPLPTMTTWRELSQFIEIKHKTLRINLYLREPWLWKVLNITTTHMNSFICLNMLNTSKALWTQPSLIMAYNLV